ncbi:Guanylate kinase [Candidatus Syntrophocurvum alkaliphilum]|uniref:Guanylate kinase n=1 Tax=Candidatus Syntrophocurvum alkaliphilum TaxID=2293317 RepID=A0A6I6DE35_9FIRM|nr:DUF1653 domain-containing protein [Candidatus Syntrophocurvum alkaliphilum]QGT99437.1 Guanylate kinase [Candidatus Syntrophocurvum alkaliphilum]
MKVFVLNGPSATGKTALMDYLLLNDNDFLEPIVSFTTRKKRSSEKDGKDYYFINREKYLEYCVDNKIIEEIVYVDNIYGITADELQRVKNTGKHGLIIMTTEGIRTLKKSLGPQNVVSIFIYRDLKEIIEVINNRDSSKQEKNRRIELAKQEIRDLNTCDYVVYNIDTLEYAYDQLKDIINKEINTEPLKIKIKSGEKYRHFKGDIFEVITIAYHSENYSPLVVYKDLQTGIVYARPYEMFAGKKELELENRIVNRFELIDD